MPMSDSNALSIFVFGTLMDPKIRFRVLGRTIPSAWVRPAWVMGFVRQPVLGRSYPMLVPRPRGRVRGQVIRNLSPRDLARLDAYEGEEYVRSPIWVWLASRRKIWARTYLTHHWVKASGKNWRPAYGVLRSRSFCQ